MEQYFAELKNQLPGYEEFEKESWAFKYDRMSIEKRVEGGGEIKTADIAHLMELFQSALLKYWQFEPKVEGESKEEEQLRTRVNQEKRASIAEERVVQPEPAYTVSNGDNSDKQRAPIKKIPVFFLDEAHKLPSLIRTDAACVLFVYVSSDALTKSCLTG